jgi:hypothetical protein
MTILEGVKILVQDWHDLHEDGGTGLSVPAVVERLGSGIGQRIKADMTAGEIAEVVLQQLRDIPGALGSARVFMDQFDSAADLLEDMDLECFVSDLSAGE